MVDRLLALPAEERLRPERRRVAVIITDLADFSAMVRGGEPARVAALLNAYLAGIEAAVTAEGGTLDPLLVGKLALDHIPLVQDLLDRGVLQPAWVRPRWLDVPGAQERLDRLRAGATVNDLYEGEVSA